MNYNLWDSFFNYSDGLTDRFKTQFERIFPIEHQLWGVKNPVWIDTNDAWRLFLEIPELRQVLDKRASMMSSNKSCILSEGTGTIKLRIPRDRSGLYAKALL